MDDKWLQAMIAMGTATVGLAIVAVLVSKSANTTGVIQSLASGYASVLSVAVSPVTGGGSSSGTSGGVGGIPGATS